MNPSTKRVLVSAMAISSLLAACAPAPAPTPDLALIQQLIQQAVELTVVAQNARATEQQALIVPSNTPLPTQTEAGAPTPTPLLPTATPFVIIPPANTVVVSGNPVPFVKPDYACDSMNRRPYDNTSFKPKARFDIKWTIVNTGKKSIRAGADLKYFSGPHMATIDRIELPELKPGDKYELEMDAIAPEKVGFHVMTWTVEGQLCFPYVAIQVER